MPLTRSMSKLESQRQSTSSERINERPDIPCTQNTTLSDGKDKSSSLINDSESCDAESWLHRFDHPLLNDLVLTLVFKYVRPSELKTCRLVCKKWNILMIPHTRSKLQVNIDTGKPSHHISKFVRLMQSNTLGKPFGIYKLDNCSNWTEDGSQFIKLCGKTAKQFNFYSGRFQIHVEHIFALLKASPNLEYFTMPSQMCSLYEVTKLFPPYSSNVKLPFLKTLNVGEDSPVHRRKICPTFFEEFLTVAENISTFVLYDENEPAKDCRSLDVLKALEKLGREASIKNLLFMHVKKEHLEILTRMVSKGLKLERLDLNFKQIGHSDEDKTDLSPIVNIFSETLQILHARSEGTRFNFKQMSKLKLLHLNLRFYSKLVIHFNSAFPVLETLHLKFVEPFNPNDESYQLQDILPHDDESCPNLKSLILENVKIK